jgi:carbonic anhydrase
MSSDNAAAEAVAAPSRFNPKRMLVAGGGAWLLVAVLSGLLVWLWPQPPAPGKSKAKAALHAAVTASAPASAAEPAAAPQVAEPVLAAAAPPDDAASTAADDPPAPPEPEPLPPRAAVPVRQAEVPIDRLQRRLGEVLGAKGAVQTGQAGELRVMARSDRMQTVSHAQQPVAATPEAAAPAAWSYGGMTGPQAWGRLKPEYSACAAGKRQSPIDIRDGIALDLDPVQFDYKPGAFAIVDTGRTIQVKVAPGNAIEVGGRRYALQQFHFHRPSEARVNGRQFEMDVQLVHKDSEGRQAVVALLLERGAAQPLLQTLWNHLPLEKQEEVAVPTAIDLNQLLPADRRYYTFMGSMTTPPCSEGVLWLVMQQPLTASARQIDIFSRLYPMNARPMQQAAGRLIKQSN